MISTSIIYLIRASHQFRGLILSFLLILSWVSPSAEGHGLDWHLRPKANSIEGAKVMEFANGNTFIHMPNVMAKDFTLHLEPEMTADQVMEALLAIYSARHGFAANISLKMPESGMHLPEEMSEALFVDYLALAGGQFLCVEENCLALKAEKRARRVLPQYAKTFVLEDKEVANSLDAELINWPIERSRVKGQVVFVMLRGTDNQTLIRSLARIRALSEAGAFVHVIAPYLPYARSDKAQRELGATAQGKLVADMLELAGANALSTVRAHAPQSIGFFDIPVIEIHGRKTINTYLETLNVEAVISPDAGFQKDAAHYASEIHVPVYVFQKERDGFGDAKLTGGFAEGIKGKIVALIDDETATGGTLAMVAKRLKELGAAQVVAVVTHLAGDAKAAIKSPDIDCFVATDTLRSHFPKDKKIQILPITEELLSGIKNAFPLPKTMEVSVASTNAKKIAAVQDAMTAVYAEAALAVGMDSASGVSAQPIGLSEAKAGTLGRLHSMDTNYGISIAIENYIEEQNGAWYDRPLVSLKDDLAAGELGVLGAAIRVPSDLVEKSLAQNQTVTVGELISREYAKHGEKIDPQDWHEHVDFANRSRKVIMEEAVFHSLYADKLAKLRSKIRLVEDFPKRGILFEDVSPILLNHQTFNDMIDILADRYRHQKIDAIAGLDARGFIIAGALASKLGTGMIMVRKKDKLPPPVIEETYTKEYGTDSIAIVDTLDLKGKRVLVVDDLIATGGSAMAAIKLLQKAGSEVVSFASLLEIPALNGRKNLNVNSFNLIPSAEAFVQK